MRLDIRKHIVRLLTTAIAAVLGSGVILGLVQANVQKWAEANGYDQYLVRWWEPVVSDLASIAEMEWFSYLAWFFIGGAVVLWVDYGLRQWAKRMGIALLLIAAAIAMLGLWLLSTGSDKSGEHRVANGAQRPTMLSGRPVSGREVVERLEQLENEHASTKQELAATKQELAATKQQLAEARQPKAPQTRSATAEVGASKPEPKRYTAYEKEQRLRAIDEIYNRNAASASP
jgi:hypothetical protein